MLKSPGFSFLKPRVLFPRAEPGRSCVQRDNLAATTIPRWRSGCSRTDAMLFIRAGYGSEVQGQGEGEQKVKKVQISYFLATGIKGCEEQTDLMENTCL